MTIFFLSSFFYLQFLLQNFSSPQLDFFSSNFFVFFGEPTYCSAELHYTGGLNCIALHWHMTGDILTCEMCPSLPFVPPYVRPYVHTSVCPYVLLPLKKVLFWYRDFYLHRLRDSVSPECGFFFPLTIYPESFWHDQMRSNLNFKSSIHVFKLNFGLFLGC